MDSTITKTITSKDFSNLSGIQLSSHIDYGIETFTLNSVKIEELFIEDEQADYEIKEIESIALTDFWNFENSD